MVRPAVAGKTGFGAGAPLGLGGMLGSAFAALLICWGCAPVPGETGASAQNAASESLTLERLYSLPHLIGTTPSDFVWSRDARRLAFSWNDSGGTFRQVWVLDLDDADGEPKRWSNFAEHVEAHEGSLRASQYPGDLLPELEAKRARELDRGVTAVAWHPDGERVLVSRQGDLSLVGTDGAATPVVVSPQSESQASYSADGRWLAFLRAGELWVTAAGGTERGERRVGPSAREGVRVGSYRWAPRGDLIALLQVDTAPVPERAIPDYLTAEPELRRLPRAYTGEPAARHRVGVTTAVARRGGPRAPKGGVQWLDLRHSELPPAPEELGHGATGAAQLEQLRSAGVPGQVLSYRWSDDARYLAVDTSDLYAKDRRVFVADLTASGAAPRLVWRDADPENETFYFWRVAWSAAADKPPLLYVLSDREDDYHVYALSPDGVDATRLTQPAQGEHWAVSEMHPVRDGLVVVANAPTPEQRHLFLVGRGGAGPMQLSRQLGTHEPVISPDGNHAAVLFSSDSVPPDLFLTELRFHPEEGRDEAQRERRVTTSPLAEFADYQWVAPQYVTFASHVDGATLHGRLTLPPGFSEGGSYPAILGSVYTDSVRNQWGGRTAHPTWGLDQYLVQQGYVLLNVDMRGSWGKGREFRRGIRLDYGGIDIEDLESGVRFLSTLGGVDRERVGIWGSSYGGLMTAMSLFRKPGLYAAGVAGAPATNVWHALTGQMAVMMEPTDQAELYADSSPFLHAAGLEDPLMIVHGMRDSVVLYRDTIDLVHRLILLDKDVELVTLPNAGHGWDNEDLAQTRFAFRRMVDFFDRHVRQEGGRQ